MKKLQINNIIKITAFTLLIFTLTFSCKNEDECEYTIVQLTIPEGCDVVSKLNLSTGIDVNGNTLPVPVTRTDGLIDPFWKLLNTPIASSCSFAADGNAYTVNIGSNGPDAWINQTGATSLSPFNAGDSRPGDCANPKNSDGSNIAYVFERSFCILKNTNVNLNFTFKADNVIYFQLVDNLTSSIIDTSSTYTYSAVPSIWNTSGINLIAGSYSIRAYLVNNESFIGFSLLGNIESASGDLALSNNADGCCENNVISILNILDVDCNDTFNTGDQFGNNWTFNLKDSSNTIIRTETTDINGNIFFAGLPNGIYTIEIVTKTGYTTNLPNGGTATVTVANNEVKIIEFYNCTN